MKLKDIIEKIDFSSIIILIGICLSSYWFGIESTFIVFSVLAVIGLFIRWLK